MQFQVSSNPLRRRAPYEGTRGGKARTIAVELLGFAVGADPELLADPVRKAKGAVSDQSARGRARLSVTYELMNWRRGCESKGQPRHHTQPEQSTNYAQYCRER